MLHGTTVATNAILEGKGAAVGLVTTKGFRQVLQIARSYVPGDVKVFPGDVLHFVTWGAGGWGDPLERDPALVELEVRRGLVSEQGARRYGVVVGDPSATEALRAQMREQRPAELPVFDMGPPLEDILANCEAETGLPAPKRPQWAPR